MLLSFILLTIYFTRSETQTENAPPVIPIEGPPAIPVANLQVSANSWLLVERLVRINIGHRFTYLTPFRVTPFEYSTFRTASEVVPIEVSFIYHRITNVF